MPLNERSKDILAFIKRFQREKGFPPTIREIGAAFGIASTNGVRYYLNRLEAEGEIHRSGKISRGIGVEMDPAETNGSHPVAIPIVGRVAAGEPILAEQSADGELEPATMFGDTKALFALRVRGDSMIDAGIHDGDYVIVRKQDRAEPGAMVVAIIDNEATVKFYRPRADRVELEPANAKYEPIIVEPGTPFGIAGVVRGVIRTVGR
jgi:repressor LexA